jgi:hypothetical protein
MRDDNGDTRKHKRTAITELEAIMNGAAVRQAYLRHIDEQQAWAGFNAPSPRAEPGARPKPPGRPAR